MDPTKERLLEAAGEEFAEKGFEKATVRSICARAGANLAAVNYHFGDKEQLYLRALIEAHRCGVEMPSDEGDPEGTPYDQLRGFIRQFLAHVVAIGKPVGWHHALMLREMMRPTKASEALVREVIRPKFERLLAILGRVCPGADDRRRNALAFSIIGQCLMYRIGRPVIGHLVGAEEFARLDLDYLADHITAFSAAALGLMPPLDTTGRTKGGGAATTSGDASCAGSR